MERQLPVITLYQVSLVYIHDDKPRQDQIVERYSDARMLAEHLCYEWLRNPFKYLVTTDGDNIRIFNKDLDDKEAVCFITEKHFVEVG